MKWRPYPTYKPSGVDWLGDVPEHWEIWRLSHFAKLKSGENITAGQLEEKGRYPVFGGNGLRGYTSHYTHSGHYVLIGRQGALCGNINYAKGNFWASEHAIVVEPYWQVSTIWLGELLRSMNLNQYSISAAQPGLAVETINALRIPIPPPPEQTAIADFLDRETGKIDTLVAKKQTLIERLKEKRTALILRTVTHGLPPDEARKAGFDSHPRLKPSGIDWLGDVPEHWEVVPLKWQARCKSGDSIPPDEVLPSLYSEAQIPVIGGNGLMGFTSKANIFEPVLVIGRVGALCGNIHEISPPAWVTDNALILNVNRNTFISAYLAAILRSRNLNEIAEKTAQPLITGTQVRDQRLPCPSIREQTAIADFLERETGKIDKLITKIETAIERLREYRTALITAAVTGKIDVQGDTVDT